VVRIALGPDSPLGDDVSRMEEKIEHDTAYADALGDLDGSPPPPPRPLPSDVDDRLAELKRRMGM
jgi:phage shock protein A